MMQYLTSFIAETIHIWLEMSFYILIGLFCTGILHVFVSKDFIARQLGKGGITSIIKATLVGIPLPVCSCGVIPLAQSLKKEGAHRSSVLSFLVSTPTTGIDSILATYALLGVLFACFRPLGALCAGVLLGVLDYLVEGKGEQAAVIAAHTHQKTSWGYKIREFTRYAFIEIPQDIGKWLIIGTLIGGFISALIPKDLFERFIPYPFDMVVALVIGTPLYVCATGSIPIAASLIQKGFSPGAGLIFLIAGPATNVVTMAFIKSQMGKKALFLYVLSILIVAAALGWLFNFVWGLWGKDIGLVSGAGEELPFLIKALSAGFLLLIIIIGRWYDMRTARASTMLRLQVPDLHCGSCQMVIEERLRTLPGVENVRVDLRHKIVAVSGNVSLEDIREKIEDAGYRTEPVSGHVSCECNERKCCG